ncbi:MAG: ATP-binding protein [Streptosporangiaceae bacterium]|jgi:anti-sigma regulatory factor (Ser/Thr protein kinase)
MCDHATLPPPPPPAAPVSWQNCTRSFPGRPDQISAVRALLSGFLDGYPTADDAVLLISELAANACAHSASGQPGGTFTVRAHMCASYLHAEVEDQGSAWDGHLRPAQAPHGLYLLRALSAACGTFPGTCGWVTWFTITNATTPSQ